MPDPIYDIKDLLKRLARAVYAHIDQPCSELASDDVPTAIKQTFRECTFKFDDVALMADWLVHPLPRKQVNTVFQATFPDHVRSTMLLFKHGLLEPSGCITDGQLDFHLSVKQQFHWILKEFLLA